MIENIRHARCLFILLLSVYTGLTRTINQTIEYCKERKAFGQPIINYQVIHYTLAELQTEVEALRSLVYRASGKYVEMCFISLHY